MAKISQAHADRLIERGLSPNLCERLGVHSHGNAIAFDYRQNGMVHNTKLRKGKGDMPFVQSGKPLIPWNIDCLAAPVLPGEALIITEGEFDAIALIQSGFERVISVPNGAPPPKSDGTRADRVEKEFAYLFKPDGKTLLPQIDQFSRIILAVDKDAPGRHLRDELAFYLRDERCFWVDWPGECKDANDVLVGNDGEFALPTAIRQAKGMWNDQLSTIDDVPDRDVVTYSTGISMLDLRIELPEFMVMMGPYGCGKSVFLRQFLWSLWKLHGWRFMLTCLEEPIKPRVVNHFRMLEIGKIRSLWTPEIVQKADQSIREAAMFLQRPWNKKMEPEKFLSFAELAASRDKVRVIALDPVNELDHTIKRNESQYWGDFIIDCKRIADQYRILFIVCGHPPKEAYKIISQGGILGAVDMSGSQHWGNKADHSLCMWKPDRFIWGLAPDDPLPTILHMEKSKDHETMGRPNLYEMKHLGGVNRFEIESVGYEMMKKRKRKSNENN